MNIKIVCVLIAACALWGCENKPSAMREQTPSALPAKSLAPAQSVTIEASAAVGEYIPTAIEAAPAGSAQAVSADAVEKAAKDAEEQVHE
jgi:hypothetical protein